MTYTVSSKTLNRTIANELTFAILLMSNKCSDDVSKESPQQCCYIHVGSQKFAVLIKACCVLEMIQEAHIHVFNMENLIGIDILSVR